MTDTIRLDTSAGAEYGLSINDGALFTNNTAVTLTLGAIPGTAQMQVSNDGGLQGAPWEPYTTHKAWTITQYGQYVIPRIVYARYKDTAGNVSNIFQDDIILDVTPPTGSFQISIPAYSAHVALAPAFPRGTLTYTAFLPAVMNVACTDCIRVSLTLSATDDVSGVGGVLVSNDAAFTSAQWQTYASQKTWWVPAHGATTVYVKFSDRAGNVSQTYSRSITP